MCLPCDFIYGVSVFLVHIKKLADAPATPIEVRDSQGVIGYLVTGRLLIDA